MESSLDQHVRQMSHRVHRALSRHPSARDRRRVEGLLVDLRADLLVFEAERIRAARAGMTADVAALDEAIAVLTELRRSLRRRLEAISQSA